MSEFTQTAPQPPGAPVPGAQPSNGLAIAAMVLGLVAVLIVWIPLLNVVSLVLAVIAVGLGIPALIKAKKVGKGTGPAVAGIVLAVFGFIGFFVVNALLVSVVDDAVDEIGQALDAADELEVTFGEASFDGFTTEVPVTVVNIGDLTQPFLITITATSPDGSEVLSTATVMTPDLAPGQTFNESAVFFIELPSDAVITMTGAI